jgi:hypothetical protein
MLFVGGLFVGLLGQGCSNVPIANGAGAEKRSGTTCNGGEIFIAIWR